MGPRHTRVANAGLFVPVWWDDRLPPPGADHDTTSFFQTLGSVSPAWPTFPAEDMTDDAVWMMQRPAPTVSPTLGPVRFYGLKRAIATITLDSAHPMLDQLEPVWPAHLRLAGSSGTPARSRSRKRLHSEVSSDSYTRAQLPSSHNHLCAQVIISRRLGTVTSGVPSTTPLLTRLSPVCIHLMMLVLLQNPLETNISMLTFDQLCQPLSGLTLIFSCQPMMSIMTGLGLWNVSLG